MSEDGGIYIFSHRHDASGIVHSSVSEGGKPLFFAGEIKIENGRLLELTAYSGHYRPTIGNVNALLEELMRRHVDVSQKLVRFLFLQPSLPRVYDAPKIEQNMAVYRATDIVDYFQSVPVLEAKLQKTLTRRKEHFLYDLKCKVDEKQWNSAGKGFFLRKTPDGIGELREAIKIYPTPPRVPAGMLVDHIYREVKNILDKKEKKYGNAKDAKLSKTKPPVSQQSKFYREMFKKMCEIEAKAENEIKLLHKKRR